MPPRELGMCQTWSTPSEHHNGKAFLVSMVPSIRELFTVRGTFSMTSTFHVMSRASAKIGCSYTHTYIYTCIYIHIYTHTDLNDIFCENHTIHFLASQSQAPKVGLVNVSHVLYSFHIS